MRDTNACREITSERRATDPNFSVEELIES